MQYPKTDVCKTISEAVEQLMRSLDRGDLERIRAMDEEDIPLLHFGLGQYIRDHFKLWHGNRELLRECGAEKMHADDASAVIIKHLWLRLQTKH